MDKKRISRAKPKPKPVIEPVQPIIIENETEIIDFVEEAKEEKKVWEIWMY